MMRKRVSNRAHKSSESVEKPAASVLVKSVEKLDLQREVFRLRIAGYDDDEIADKLNLTKGRVQILVAEAYNARAEERDRYAERFLTTAIARYEALLKVWWPRATGFFDTNSPVVDENGPVHDEHGNQTWHWVEPCPKAAKLVREFTRDAAEALGLLNKMRVEHTGKDGGKVEIDFNVDFSKLSDDQISYLERHPNLDTAVRTLYAVGAGGGKAA